MATTFNALLSTVRDRLIEPVAKFWTDAELIALEIAGARDLWRSVVDLKGEHYLTIDVTNVTLDANADDLSNVPADIHKIYNIEPRDMTTNGNNHGLVFQPREYNDLAFQSARGMDPIDPSDAVIYYAVTGLGTPVSSPVILTAPQVTSQVLVTLMYIPSLGALTGSSYLPIPGEADNAIIAWTVAYARAKEREDRSPDPAWLSIYATEKQNILQSLGLREYQEPEYVPAIWEPYWG